MLTRADSVALLKVLIAAAWADSGLSQSELNYIKMLAKQLQLTDADWHELEPHLEERPNERDIEALFRDLLLRIGTPYARDQIVRHLEEILNADSRITAEEYDFLEQYTQVLKEASTVQLLVGRMKSLFRRRPPAPASNLDEFVRNKILFKLRHRLGSEVTPELHRLCLLGGLMGIVAQADGEIGQRELEEIRSRLQVRGLFEEEVLGLLLSIIGEEAVRGLDRARLISEYAGKTTFEERVQLLDLLFAVAAADGGLTHAELEELRGISSAMHLSHKQYIDAKVRARG